MGAEKAGERWRFIIFALPACVALILARPAYGDELAAQARQLADKWKNAVVTVRLVIKTSMSVAGTGAEESEEKCDATATVIDPSGLAVVSLSQTDPSELMNRFMGDMSYGDMKFKMDSKVSSMKLRFADGKEVPAKVVLRDKDLDLAFVRPEQKLAQPVPALDLTDSSLPAVADQCVVVDRMREIGDWQTQVGFDRISAVLSKPRKMYVPGAVGAVGGLGAPAFTLDGKVIGIQLMRSRPPSGRSAGGMSSMFSMGMGDMGMMPVILPAADILEAAKQATE